MQPSAIILLVVVEVLVVVLVLPSLLLLRFYHVYLQVIILHAYIIYNVIFSILLHDMDL